MTAASVKDPASLAYRIMVDANSELQAVEKIQQLSIQQNRQETQRLRQEFSARQSIQTPSPTENKSPRPIVKEVHFNDEHSASNKPAIAPKPRPRLEFTSAPPSVNASKVTASAPVKGVRFDIPIAVEVESDVIEPVRPPPGYENDNDTTEETDSGSITPSTASLPLAPPPYNVAVNHRNMIKHVRQSEIQQSESLLDLLPATKNSLHREHLSDSREQLVDGSDQEGVAFYENGGFEVSDSEFEHHIANYVDRTRESHNVTAVSNHTNINHIGGNATSNGPMPKIKPAIKPYPKQHNLPNFKGLSPSGSPPSSYHNSVDILLANTMNNSRPGESWSQSDKATDISQMDYVNVYEDDTAANERYVGDINHHYVEDLYPETSQSYPSRSSRLSGSNATNGSWAYNSNQTPGALPFYMAEGMKASEC